MRAVFRDSPFLLLRFCTFANLTLMFLENDDKGVKIINCYFIKLYIIYNI
jgi:hypothetical protein